MGIFNSGKDKARQNPKHGSGYVPKTPLKKLSGRAKDKALESLVDYKTGRVLVATTSGTVKGVRGTVRAGSKVWRLAKRFIDKAECPICKKPCKKPMQVHPGNCARKLAAQLFNEEAEVEKLPTAMEAQADRHQRWNNITGGIQYDKNGQRIWFDDEGNRIG